MTREEAIEWLNKLYIGADITDEYGDMEDMQPYGEAVNMAIEALEQEPKTGHWIEHPEIETSTPEYLMFYECSECGDKQCFCKSDIHKKRFCGNCGYRMVESQESEDKE